MKTPYNYQPINPNHVIDLRPKPSRVALTWQDLTAVKIVLFFYRLILRLIIVIFDTFYRLVRNFAMFFVDLVFGAKEVALDLKYASAEQGIKIKRFSKFLIKIIFIVPRAIFKLLTRSFYLVKNTTNRVEVGLKRETKILATPVIKRQHSFSWQIFNFIFLLCLLASPFFAYIAWQKSEPFRNNILSSTTTAFAGLFSAKDLIEQQNFAGAETAFTTASTSFIKAQADLKNINSGLLELAGLLPNKKFKLASESEHLLKAGSLSASIGAELAATVAPAPNSNLVFFLDRFVKHAIPASDEAATLTNELNKINVKNLPADYQAKFSSLKEQADLLAPSLKESALLAQQANIFFGKQIDKRYLLVFQNNSEKRASGGFMGSFAVVDFNKGELKNLTVPKGGTYDTEAGLYARIVAPEPLWLLNPLWHFWDANWWPDWPTTARKLEWFYEKSNGPTVDGVISLTPTVIENLLRVHGSVDMTKDYGVVITADNFWEVTQTFAEQKPSVTKEPKKIIGDLMTKLMEDLPKDLDLQKSISLLGILEQSLNEKQILLYFNDDGLESSVKQFGWDGAIKETAKDYLMVVSTNIGGQKSDHAIVETLTHKAEILPDGQIIVNLTINRQHTAEKNQPFIGFRNVDWLRIYVPANSQLISASGFRTPDQSYFKTPDPKWTLDPDLENERQAITDPASGTKIYYEAGKTVFANWSMIDPGETANIELKYRLPFTMKPAEDPKTIIEKIKKYILPESSDRYSLLVQKQPGATSTTINSNLIIDRGWQTFYKYPDELKITNTGWAIEKSLDTDLYTTVLFK